MRICLNNGNRQMINKFTIMMQIIEINLPGELKYYSFAEK